MTQNEIIRNYPETREIGTSLFPQERWHEITRRIKQQKRVTVSELSNLFAVSEVTVRKDLAQLESHGVLKRTHGGAVEENRSLAEQEFGIREQLQQPEKQRIGESAAQLIQDGNVIVLDASTTALYLARELKDVRKLTVVTNGIRVGLEFADCPDVTVLMPGGSLRRAAFSLVGSWGEGSLRQIHIQKAFVGAEGLTLPEGLTDTSTDEVHMKRTMVDTAKEVIAIIDHTKWGKVAVATFCQLDQLRLIITDRRAPENMVDQVRSQGIDVWTV